MTHTAVITRRNCRRAGRLRFPLSRTTGFQILTCPVHCFEINVKRWNLRDVYFLMIARLEDDRSETIRAEVVEAEFKDFFHVDHVAFSQRRHDCDVRLSEAELLLLCHETPDATNGRFKRVLAAVVLVHVLFMPVETDGHT